jgi:RNA polymerase sigma-70 factor, ECF subfamily
MHMTLDPEDSASSELLASVHDGEQQAIQSLLERHMPTLRAFVRLRTNQEMRARESVSDLVQSICREVLERPDQVEFRGESAFKNWLFGKVLNKVRDRHRHAHAEMRDVRREQPMVRQRDDRESLVTAYTSICEPPEAVMKAELLIDVEKAFGELSEEQREVLTLSKLVGLDHQEIADRMGKSYANVRQISHRAMVRLSAIMMKRHGGSH